MAIQVSDYLLLPSVGNPNLFIRAVNNATGTAYVSAARTALSGNYRLTGLPPGSYTISTSPDAVTWTVTEDINYLVPITDSYTYDQTNPAAQAVFLVNNRNDGVIGVAKPVYKINLSTKAALYGATVDYAVGIFLEDFCANGTSLDVGVHGSGDGIFAQNDDTNIAKGGSGAPGNAINVWSGAGPASSQLVDSGSGGTVTYDATHLTDTSKVWTVNQWANNGAGVGRWVSVNNGAVFGLVLSNTATVLTVAAWVAPNAAAQMVPAATPANGTAYALPQSDSTGINIQRWGTGNAIKINGEPGSGNATGMPALQIPDLIQVTQNVNTRSFFAQDFGTTTADSLGVTITAKTSGNILNLFHGTSAFTGSGLIMNFGTGTGSFSGSYVQFSLNSVAKFAVGSDGSLFMAAGTKIDTFSAGILNIGQSTATTISIGRSGQQVSLQGQTNIGIASANFLVVSGAAAAGAPSIVASGSDTNIGIVFQVKATQSLFVQSTTLANYLQLNPAATGVGPQVQASGSDVNIDLTMFGKGTGLVNLGLTGARLRVDSFGHWVSDSAGAPATSALGANVTSVTPTGNDTRGKLVIVMSGALAANTKICHVAFVNAYGATPVLILLVNQTQGAGLGIVDFYYTGGAATGFDLFADQALAAGTYECEYLVVG